MRRVGSRSAAASGVSIGVAVGLLLLVPGAAEAYVGPGAGFALVSSFLTLFITFILAIFTLLTWPIRAVTRTIRGRKALAKARCRRVVIVGLDGQDPDLTERFMARGLMPNFEKLKKQGGFARLATTLLAESPVAWSSFQTGANPGKHRIYDFLVPNRKSHLPELSSARVEPPPRSIRLGKWRIPIGKPLIAVGRKSRPFWAVLGDCGVFSTILRVPITFPPEKHYGVLLSAMNAPDLKGSQGTYTYFTSDPEEKRELTSGIQRPLAVAAASGNGAAPGRVARGEIPGPENPMREGGGELRIPFELRMPEGDGAATLAIGKSVFPLALKAYTPWVPLEFAAAPGVKIRGLARFHLIETQPGVRLYMTPIHIDPAKPALPISHPFTYSIYLAKTLGPFATLGVAEDTSALNEGVIDEAAFLEQTYDIHAERERMFFDAMEKTRRGLVACVFDITDRVQHMCFRHLEADHPANRGRDFDPKATAIEKLYRDMDDLVGRVIARLKSGDVLMVMSDHGFKSFRRGVNLNTFLLRNGFLCLKENSKGGDMFAGVDWARTKAYAVGFGGIYLNVKGRESDGIVEPEAAGAVKREIAERLKALYDEKERVEPVREVYDSREVYCGPYAADAPDLIVGFRPGHRVAWSSVTGGFSEEIIEDNARPWSGDHNFNPPDVPGILFANRRFAPSPRIVDIGPTVLDLFGVSIPKWCDGRSIVPTGAERQREEDSQHKDAKDAKDGKDTEDGKDAEKESAVVS